MAESDPSSSSPTFPAMVVACIGNTTCVCDQCDCMAEASQFLASVNFNPAFHQVEYRTPSSA